MIQGTRSLGRKFYRACSFYFSRRSPFYLVTFGNRPRTYRNPGDITRTRIYYNGAQEYRVTRSSESLVFFHPSRARLNSSDSCLNNRKSFITLCLILRDANPFIHVTFHSRNYIPAGEASARYPAKKIKWNILGHVSSESFYSVAPAPMNISQISFFTTIGPPGPNLYFTSRRELPFFLLHFPNIP